MGYTRKGFILPVLVGLIVAATTHSGDLRPAGLPAVKEYPFGRGNVKWVSTQWLQDNLNDPNLSVLDTQPDIYDYFAGHIPARST